MPGGAPGCRGSTAGDYAREARLSIPREHLKILQRDVSTSLDMTGYFVRLNLPVKR